MVNSSLVLIEIIGCQGGKLFLGKCGMVIKKKFLATFVSAL